MLEKICRFTNLRSLSVLSRAQVKLGNISSLRCCSINSSKLMCSQPLSSFSKPIFKSSPHLTSLQLTKIIGNNFIQKQCYSTHGNHVTLWKLERIVAASFIPLLPLCFICESTILDSALALFSVLHVHWGLEAIIVDYARPLVVGPIIPKVCMVLLYLLSAVTLGGLMVLVYNGPGISKVVKNGWAIGKDK